MERYLKLESVLNLTARILHVLAPRGRMEASY